MKRHLIATAIALASAAAQAAEHHFELRDLATFSSYTSVEPLAFTGSGFASMLDDVWSGAGPIWMHGVSVEQAQYSRTLMQVDLGALGGQRVVSATLSFMLLDGQEEPGASDVLLRGFDGGSGVMQLHWDAPPTSFGYTIGNVERSETVRQSIDITSLVGYSVGHGQRWIGLHMQSLSAHNYFTSTHEYPDLLSPDRAQLRLDVVTAPVPEPASWALLGGGLAIVGWMRRRLPSGASTRDQPGA